MILTFAEEGIPLVAQIISSYVQNNCSWFIFEPVVGWNKAMGKRCVAFDWKRKFQIASISKWLPRFVSRSRPRIAMRIFLAVHPRN